MTSVNKMNNTEWSNLQAIKDCTELIQRYPIDLCLEKSRLLCDSLNDEDKFNRIMQQKRRNSCMKEITRLSISKWGARNVYAALLYLSGNTEAAQLHLQAYKYDSEEAQESLNKLFEQ